VTAVHSTGDVVVDPERSVWAAAVLQAFADAVSVNRDGRLVAARAEAIMFLTAEHGPWAEAREAVCDASGVLPAAVRERALAMLRP
jgi:hypothetical protein